jgi:hypothetical protein
MVPSGDGVRTRAVLCFPTPTTVMGAYDFEQLLLWPLDHCLRPVLQQSAKPSPGATNFLALESVNFA